MRVFILTLMATALLGAAAIAAPSKLRIDGERLIYDTNNVGEGEETGIIWDDIAPLLALLKDNPQVTTLELNSGGGYFNASSELARRLIDFDLHTYVNGECASMCVRVFLAGTKRTLARGSLIGFHQLGWDPQSIKEYYDANAANEGWGDPFEFASWNYTDTQTEVHERLSYMIARGVDPVFAIESLQYTSGEMWYPERAELLTAGVLTE